MRIRRIKKAFSLIELSIVLLIIGIILAGAIQSSRLISVYKIIIAQSLTQNSPVHNISGLIAWWESASENSFIGSEAENGNKVSIWKDVSTQSSIKYNATQETENNKPIYTANIINNLPALKFNGSSQYLAISHDTALNPENFTIFAIVKTVACGYYCSIINSRYSNPPQGFTLYTSTSSYELWLGNGSYWAGMAANATLFTPLTPELLTATYNNVMRTLYYKGTATDSGSLTAFVTNSSTTPLRIGSGNDDIAGYFYNGYIGELILFNRNLKVEERTSIEAYLKKKWDIS